MVFGIVWEFLKRHRRKFLFSGAVAGGVLVVGKVLQWKLADATDRRMAESLILARRQQHFASNQDTCFTTVRSLLPTVQETVLQALDTESLTTILKSNPPNKIQVWQEVKVLTFSRFMVGVYSSCLLVVFLRVQFNVLGGYLFLDSNAPTSNTLETLEDQLTLGGQVSQDVQRVYLSTVHYFLSDGLAALIRHVQQKVESEVSSISLRHPLKTADLEHLMMKIRQLVEDEKEPNKSAQSGSMRMSSFLSRFLLPSEQSENQGLTTANHDVTSQGWMTASRDLNGHAYGADCSDNHLQQLSDETRDILESQDFGQVLKACLDAGFSSVIQHLASALPDNEEGVKVARLLPLLNTQTLWLFKAQGNDQFVQLVLSLPLLQTFATHIYEAFSQSPTSPA